MRPKHHPCLPEGPQTRRTLLKTTLQVLLSLPLIEETATAFAQAPAASASPSLIEVHAYGHTLGDVIAHVSPLTPWRLSVSREITNERVAIAFRGSAEEFLKGLASLFAFSWVDLGGTQAPKVRQLQMVRSTRSLEEQLRMDPFTKMASGLKGKADKTLAITQEAPNTLYKISSAWGERFLSLLTSHEIARALEQGFLVATVGELTTAAQDALFHFVEARLKAHAVELPEYKAKLDTLTPDKVRASTIVFRVRSTPEGGYVKVNVLGVDTFQAVLLIETPQTQRDDSEAVLVIEAPRFPQRTSPYIFAAKQGPSAARAAAPKQIASSPRVSADASKGSLEVQVPGEWGEMIAVVQRNTGKNVFSDYYTPDLFQEQGERDAKRYRSLDAPGFLDDLCKDRKAIWWEQSGAVCIRHQFWYMRTQCEPPLSLRRQLEGDIRAGSLRSETLDALAALTRPRLLTLLQHTAVDAESDVDESAFADFLELYKAGTSRDHLAMLEQGLPLDQFSPELLEALRRLAPDSPIAAAAYKSPAAFFLKMKQTPLKENGKAKRSSARLEFNVTGPASAASQRFEVPVKESIQPMVVLGVKG
jgi:hypothetical protein